MNLINFIAALSVLFSIQSVFAQIQSSDAQPAQQIAIKVDEYIKAAVSVDRFSGSVLVAQDGKPLISKGYGMANYELKVPNAPNTVFQLGSITKQFTSVAIMMLQERGKLKTGDPICQYIKDCPAAWQIITIRQLLSHTSGIPNYTNDPDFGKIQVMKIEPPGMIDRFRDKPLDFAPGEKWSYSNSGYYLLGMIIEKVSGESYPEFLQKNVFNPLGLKHTDYGSHSRIIENRASGYALEGETCVNAAYGDMTIPYAAGALYSTAEDLLIWDQSLYTNKLISRKSFDEMLTPVLNDYAYGWENRKKFDHQVIEHGGDIDGFSCYLSRFIDSRITIIVLANRERTATRKIANDLAAIVFGAPYVIPQERKTVALDKKTLEKYVGQYQINPNFILIITLENGKLIASVAGQPTFSIYPESETNFFYKAINAEITFIKNAAGDVTGIIFHQNGKNFPAQKNREKIK